MKKYRSMVKIFTLMLSISVYLIVPISADSDSSQNVTLTSNGLIQEKGNIYIIKELGETYEIEFFDEYNDVRVNDKFYSIDDYVLAANNQSKDSQSKNFLFYLSEMNELPKLEREISILSSTYNSPPTTGYGSLKLYGYVRVYSGKITISAGVAVVALAANSWKIGVTAAKQFLRGLVELHGDGQKDGTLYNKTWQAYHSSCPAFREQRLNAVVVEGEYIDGTTYTNIYEWTAGPSEQYCW